ncbi:hypothetical protein ABH912_001454 [Pseudomonas sp. BT76 TE3572]|uniref:Uncharacterized protein n=1 Tax=Pseudomonas mandelii PD30 TaxID=1419583 RepID=A0A059L9F5_9PSED|nr:hypothetical protein [Pseudomonas mandelii]KDD70725.1 hypothetical protein V466_02445 [Pseudomonas mandelii PD30]
MEYPPLQARHYNTGFLIELDSAVIIGLFSEIQRPDCAEHQRQTDDLSGIARYPYLAVA